MRSYWIRILNPVTDVLMKTPCEDIKSTQREEGHVKIEAEIGVMKQRQGIPRVVGNHRSKGKAGQDSS